MNFNKYLKLFILLIFTVIISLPSFSEVQFENILSKIIIDEPIDKNFNINLIFEKEFNGNAFIQKRQNGSYYVFVPNTDTYNKDIKVIYKDGKNKSKIKINVEKSVYQKDNSDTAYIKLDVNTANGYTIDLYSKTIEQLENEPFVFGFNLGKTICLLILLVAFAGLIKIVLSVRKSSYKYSRSINSKSDNKISDNEPVSIPDAIESVKPKKEEFINKGLEEFHILPKIKKTQALRHSDNESFSCFDIPMAEDLNPTESTFALNNPIKQNPKSIMEKTAKSKVSNPISKAFIDEAAQLDLPVVEDIKTEKTINLSKKTNDPELLSELRITPTKGFYLTTVNDTFGLFGFVGANIIPLKQFSDLSQINLQARFYDRQKDSDLYIVRLDSYKAMIEINDTGMKELAVL